MSDASSPNSDEPPPLPKRGRSSEDFLTFCKMILDYENYDAGSLVRERHTSSPLGSTGDSSLSSFHDETYHHSVHISDGETVTDDLDDEDEEITCYCRKPYGGRPMIECTSCQIWVHLTCAKVRRTNIPDTWNCKFCSAKSTKGGAKSRGRKTQLRTKQRDSLAVHSAVLTKNKRRL